MNSNFTDFDAATTLVNLQTKENNDSNTNYETTLLLKKLKEIQQKSNSYRDNLIKDYPNLYSFNPINPYSEETFLNLLKKPKT
jgi:hypothetical protein